MSTFNFCQMHGCNKVADIECLCTDFRYKFCQEHYGFHTVQIPNLPHKPHLISGEVSKEEIQLIKRACSQLTRTMLTDLLKKKNNVIALLMEQIREIDRNFAVLSQAILARDYVQNKVLEDIDTYNKIPYFSQLPIMNLLGDLKMNDQLLENRINDIVSLAVSFEEPIQNPSPNNTYAQNHPPEEKKVENLNHSTTMRQPKPKRIVRSYSFSGMTDIDRLLPKEEIKEEDKDEDKKDDEEEKQDPPNGEEEKKDEEEELKEWTCTHCTFINQPKDYICSICTHSDEYQYFKIYKKDINDQL